MLSNLAFTLYDIFGYLIPGSVAFGGLATLFWALFNGSGPMRVASFQPKVATSTVILVGCYVLGHAAQAVGNKLLGSIEKSALEMKSSPAVRQAAWKLAATLLGVSAENIDARWVYRTLDEYGIQNGIAGDRDMFIYREGFYRASCISLFFLAASLIVRAVIPGASVLFASWTLEVTSYEFAATVGILAGIGWLFLERYRRFAEYRVTRAALSAVILLRKSSLAIPVSLGEIELADKSPAPSANSSVPTQ